MDNTLKIAGFSSVFSMQNIFFKKNTDPEESSNIISVSSTDRPYFFTVLPVGQKINLVSP